MKVNDESKCEKELITRIQNLEQKLLSISEDIASKFQPEIQYNVYIDKIDVQSLMLDELNFSLESIDIEELSGAMNIGNTFSPSIEKKPKIAKEKNTKENRKKQPDIKVTVNGKNIAYKVAD